MALAGQASGAAEGLELEAAVRPSESVAPGKSEMQTVQTCSTSSGHSSWRASKCTNVLQQAKRAAFLRRMRVTCLSVLFFLVILSSLLVLLMRIGQIPGVDHFVQLTLVIALAPWSSLALLLGLFPTDKRVIQVGVSILSAFLSLFAVFTSAAVKARFALRSDRPAGEACRNAGTIYTGPIGCSAEFAILISISLWVATYLLAAVQLLHGLWRLRARQLLERLWHVLGTLIICQGSLEFSFCFILAASGVFRPVMAFYLCALANFILVGVLLRRPQTRVQFQGWLAGVGGQQSTAAAVASLIGGASVDQVLTTAKDSFRCVCCSQITYDMMHSSTPDTILFQYTEQVKLKECDAFLSHSWHDDPDAKWNMLQSWRAEFVARHGREPRLWIDKFSIDQGNIAANLQCLPVFLSGCRRLTIFAGTTYLSRLWCIVEVFVFLQMSGMLGQLELFALMDQAGFERQIADFDVRQCRTFVPEDSDHLLGVVEAGFASLDLFNDAVREMLGEALRNTIVRQGDSRATSSWDSASM